MNSDINREILTFGLLAEGFPPDIHPVELAQLVFYLTGGIRVKKVARLKLKSDCTTTHWILLLSSHEDQKKCLMQFKTLPCNYGCQTLTIRFDPAHLDIPPPLEDWIDIGFGEQMNSNKMDTDFGDTDLPYGQRGPSEGFQGPQVPSPYLHNPSAGDQFYRTGFGMHPNQYPPQPGMFQPYFPVGRFGMGVNATPGYMTHGFSEMRSGQGTPVDHSNRQISSSELYGDGGHPGVGYDSMESADFSVLSVDKGSMKQKGGREYYLKVTELPSQVTEQELRNYFQDRKQCSGGPVERVIFNSQENMAAIYFTDTEVVQRVISRAPLLMKKKKICVEVGSSNHQEESHEETCTVEVRGLDEESVEIVLLYFENPRKGGGDIKEQCWDDNKKVLYLTFNDAKVAEHLVNSSHTVAGKVLTVTLHQPQLEENSDQCTVEVRGFDPDKEEVYRLYFENPRKGGGDIVNLLMNEDRTVMYITFESPEVAEQVVKSPHTFSGRELQVNFAPKADLNNRTSTVMVKGCDLNKEEMYKMYFENPKYGGGDIKEMSVDLKHQAIYITFESPEVAETVCNRPQIVCGREVEVTLHRPQVSVLRQKSREEQEAQEEAQPRTIQATVGQQIQSEDTYLFYFENKRRGGGEVEKVEIIKEKGLVLVTFVSPEVAQQIVERQHIINGQNIEVKLYIPPKPRPTYPNKLLIQNVKESTTRDCLSMFLENTTGFEPEEIIYGDEVGVVLVSFTEEPDFKKVQDICQKKTLEGNRLTVSKVPISNCLLVENLNPKTSEDTISLYFENNKRSLGGAVERVEMLPGENKCLVYFEDHQVIDGVLTKTHTIDQKQLTVKRFMECLGPSGGSPDGNIFIVPKPLALKDVDSSKIAFVRQSSTAQDGFIRQISVSHGLPKFVENTVTVECTLTSSIHNARTLVRTWPQDVQQAVNKYMDLLEVHRLGIMQEIWLEVEKAINSITMKNKDAAVCFMQPQDKTILVVGIKSMAKDLFEQISKTVKDIEEEVDRKKKEIKETNKNLKTFQLRLLAAMSFQTEAEKRHEHLKIEIRSKKREITFHGLLKDVKEAQIEMFGLLQQVKSDKIPEMSPLQKMVLNSKETHALLVNKFKTEKIVAVWDQEQEVVSVYAFSDNDVVKAVHIIRKSVVQHIIPLTVESAHLLHSQEWHGLVKTMVDAHPGKLKITPSHDNQQIFITGCDDILHGVLEEIQRFMQENTIYHEVYSFSPSRQKFVSAYWKDKLFSLSAPLKAYKVQVTMDKDGEGICVKGTEKGLQLMKTKLQDLGEKIICHMESMSEPAKIKFLSSDNCTKDLDILGRNNQCVVALTEESNELQVVGSGVRNGAGTPQITDEMKTVSSVQLPSGVTISVVQGDMTQLSVDVIVNAANGRMDHIGGLARHIVDKGGKSIQDESFAKLKSRGSELPEGEVLVTGAGKLQCKAIIHAVGPMYRGGRSGEEDCLFDTVSKCLDAANSARHTSIAIPAISSGIFNYPVGESTQVVLESIKTYIESHRRISIQKIYLCDVGADTVRHFCNAIQKVFPKLTTASSASQPASRNAMSNTSKAFGNKQPQSLRRNISVAILDGEIAKQKADVIVNSTSNGLDLKNGAVSASILAVGGTGLQDECRASYPKGIQTGEIARTSAHGLACREVFHLALCNYNNPSAEQILHDVMIECLKEASKSHYTSIAFPALGTGNLGYPRNVVASTMLGAINLFQETTPASTLREVVVVVFRDTQTIQEFQSVYKQVGMQSSGSSPSTVKPGNRQSRKFSEPEMTSGNNTQGGPGCSGAVEFEIAGLRLLIKQADITEEKVDAIINSSNSSLDLNRGAVASALKTKCGGDLEKECHKRVSEIQIKGVTVTKAYKLKSKIIIHVDADRFHKDWEDCIRALLKEAEDNGVHSLAMPALGTGAYGRSPAQSAKDLFGALVTFCSGPRKSVKEVHVVLFDRSMIPPFVSTIQALGEKQKSKNSGIVNWFKAITGYTSPSMVQTSSSLNLKLYVYAANQSNVQGFLTALGEFVTNKFTRKEISDETLTWMNVDQLKRIEQIGKQNNVELQIQPPAGRIVMDGLHSDVFEVWQKISQILREADRWKQEQQAASVLANMVHWCYMEVLPTGTELKEYGIRENHTIEMAYQSKKKTADITDSTGTVYIVDFDSMTEYPRNNPSDAVNVIRKDKIKGSDMSNVPDTWAHHATNEQVKLVTLQPTDAEYQTVEANFRKTLGPNGSSLKIVTVERVQNPTLYLQYQAKKAHMDKQNAGNQNEKILWHGTAVDAIQNINNYGFNRSYCGKNATMYGQGVYFAVNSQYSAQPTYTPPDTAGRRYMYQCKVLAGCATRGDQNLRVLPPRAGHVLYDSATDNVNNPGMFVIFNDTQAYPEYMIVFS